MDGFGADIGARVSTKRETIAFPIGTSDWIVDRAMELRSDPEALAKLIAQHETPPVDEAAKLYHAILVSPDPIATIRDHLAKVRAERA